ncbi:MAG: hypothetical protein IPM74_04515 [Crocinitomicaceae bacterium]|nr:hypothetical protein [Crocinitomicaceae bacterium]MBK8925173.1 hypothetical protein [Crocinitomicaceae bacterium]
MKIDLGNFKKFGFEVFIIFTGITLSFLFDEWRSERQRVEIEQEYFIRLKSDLTHDTSTYESFMQHSIEKYKYCEVALGYFSGDSLADSIFSFINSVFLFTPYQHTYQEMLSTGSLYSMKTDTLKYDLIEYYSLVSELIRINDIAIEINDRTQQILNRHLELISEENNFGKFKIAVPLSDNLELKNLIFESRTYTGFLKGFIPLLNESAKKLIDLIEQNEE